MDDDNPVHRASREIPPANHVVNNWEHQALNYSSGPYWAAAGPDVLMRRITDSEPRECDSKRRLAGNAFFKRADCLYIRRSPSPDTLQRVQEHAAPPARARA